MRGLVQALLASLALSCGYVRPIALDQNPFEAYTPQPLHVYSVEWFKRLILNTPLLEYAPRETAQPAVDPQTQRVAVAARDGVLHCFSKDGVEIWHLNAKGPFFSTGTFRGGVLYVPGGDGILYAIDAETGTKLWTYDAGEELISNVAFTPQLVLALSETNTLFAVDIRTGKWAWQYRRDMPSGFSIHGASTPLVAGETVYVGFADGHLSALTAADGTLRWDRDLSSGSQFLDVDTSPVLDSAGHLFVASFQTGIYCLQPDSGNTVWHRETKGVTSLLLVGGTVVAAGDQRVASYSVRRGEEIWTRRLGNRAAFLPALAGSYLLVPTAKALLFLDVVTGKQLQLFDPGKGVTATPAVMGPRVYVLSNEGFFYAFRLSARAAG
jgi:outer membrane protein assembly factor BamB